MNSNGRKLPPHIQSTKESQEQGREQENNGTNEDLFVDKDFEEGSRNGNDESTQTRQERLMKRLAGLKAHGGNANRVDY